MSINSINKKRATGWEKKVADKRIANKTHDEFIEAVARFDESKYLRPPDKQNDDCLAYDCDRKMSDIDMYHHGRLCFKCLQKNFVLIREKYLKKGDLFKYLITDGLQLVTGIDNGEIVSRHCTTRNGQEYVSSRVGINSERIIYLYKKQTQ
jgi:hypothetical protein